MDSLLPRLSDARGELSTRTKDIADACGRFTTAMGAMVTAGMTVRTMIDGFTGHGFSEATKPQPKEVQGHDAALLTARDEAQKQLDTIRKDKALLRRSGARGPKRS